MKQPTRILFIENNQESIALFNNEMRKSGIDHTLLHIASFDLIPETLEEFSPEIIVFDYAIVEIKPSDTISILKNMVATTPLIIYSNVLNEEIVVECMRSGAADYVFKQHSARLGSAIENAIDKRRVQEELRSSKERFNTLAKVSTVGIFLTSSDGSYLYVNERWTDITGLGYDKAFGEGFLNAVHSHDRKRIRTEWHRCVQEQSAFQSEYRVYRESDEKELWVFGQALPEFNPDGSLAGFVGTITDITERMNSEIEIDTSRKQLRALTVRLQNIREEERTHIAREIHDDLGQALTGLKMDLVWLNNKLTDTDVAIQKRMKSMMLLADSTIHNVRKLATDLRPGILDDIGLAAAIEWQGKDFGERTGINFSFHLDEELHIDEKRATAFFRIFQEAVTNVIRHADAKNIIVSLRKESNNVLLMIEDDGRGIAPHEITNLRSVGLLGMKERAASFNGEVQVLGQHGVGTTVRVRIPLAGSST
ncbi:MAG: PAS domain S-box protein [Bacteroidota bacterium]|nr:PAS domain S-box protein [Bacteroidota bacterium]